MDLRNETDRRLLLRLAGVLLAHSLAVWLFVRHLWSDEFLQGVRLKDDDRQDGFRDDGLGRPHDDL